MKIEIVPTPRTSPAWGLIAEVESRLTRCSRAVFDLALDINVLDAQMFAEKIGREFPEPQKSKLPNR